MFDMSILYCEKDNKKSRREEQTRLLSISIFFLDDSSKERLKNRYDLINLDICTYIEIDEVFLIKQQLSLCCYLGQTTSVSGKE